jgi:hypothetical protein
MLEKCYGKHEDKCDKMGWYYLIANNVLPLDELGVIRLQLNVCIGSPCQKFVART